MKAKKHRLGDLCRMVKGTSPTLKTEPGPYPLVVTAAYRRTADSWQLEGPAVCIPLVSSTGHGDAALHRVHYQDGKFALANLLVALLPNDPSFCDAQYLYHLLMVQKDELLVSLMQGTANVSLKEKDIAGVEISLPPLAEQRRLVARIEELSAQIHEARTLRHQAAEEAAAFLTTARRAVMSDSRAKTVALEDACEAIIDNLHSNPTLSETGIPCVRSPDVGYGTLNLDSAQRTDEDEFRKRTVRGEPKADDIVLVREGGGTGKCAVVLPGQRFSLGQRVMMLRPNAERILPRFFLHQLLSPQIQEDQIAPLSKGSASPHLNIGTLRRFNLVLPPLPEQRRIVAELDALQSEVEALKRLQAETATELDALLPAILDHAFKGEL